MSRVKARAVGRGMRAANDNTFRRQAVEPTPTDDTPSLADVGPIMAVAGISAATFYVISTVILGYLRSFPLFYP